MELMHEVWPVYKLKRAMSCITWSVRSMVNLAREELPQSVSSHIELSMSTACEV